MSSENKVIKKAIEYFTTHDVLLQSELESFLKFVDLFSVWNSEADQQIVWQILSKSSSVNSVDKESVLEGIKQFIDNDTLLLIILILILMLKYIFLMLIRQFKLKKFSCCLILKIRTLSTTKRFLVFSMIILS